MPFSDQTIFITGFPGFIAERLVKHLEYVGYAVTLTPTEAV